MLKCPYCRKSFDPQEILFYADTADDRFMYPMDATRDAKLTASTGFERQATRVGAIRSGDNRSLVQKQEKEEQKEAPEGTKEFPLGIQTDDYIAKDFFKQYGEGRTFRFQRIATFYGIRNQEMIENGDPDEFKGYGYISRYEDDAETIPSQLTVPGRGFNRQKLTRRVCPKCHCDIPTGYFITGDEYKHIAALAGSTSAGKTQFVTVALRELESSLGRLNLGTMEWTQCSSWFNLLYVEKYKQTEGRNEATNIDTAIFPLMFSVTRMSTNERHFITIYDCAGEYAKNSDYAANLQGFETADTLLLMIDSMQFFRDQAHPLGEGENPCFESYTRSLQSISNNDLCQNVERVITVITKCDTILGQSALIHGASSPAIADGMLAYEYDMGCHQDAVNIGVIRQLDKELTAMLENNRQTKVKEFIERNVHSRKGAPEVNFLAVSTYVHRGCELVRDVEEEAGHHRLIEPLLYAMAMWEVLDWKDEQQEIPVNTIKYVYSGEEVSQPENRNGQGIMSIQPNDRQEGERPPKKRSGLFGLFRRNG